MLVRSLPVAMLESSSTGPKSGGSGVSILNLISTSWLQGPQNHRNHGITITTRVSTATPNLFHQVTIRVV